MEYASDHKAFFAKRTFRVFWRVAARYSIDDFDVHLGRSQNVKHTSLSFKSATVF